MNNKSYDLLVVETEEKILQLLGNSGLTITTMSLLLDKIKTSVDRQKEFTILSLKNQNGELEEKTME